MKKLMIAAAAAAMVGGVYATTGCDGCNNEAPAAGACNVAVYNLKFTLKTLANKSVKNGECVGYYYEQGTRTLDGLLWSCCEDCNNWLWNANGDDTDWQYSLWEKKTKRVFTQGVEWQKYADGDSKWAAVGTYVLDGQPNKTLTSTYEATKAAAVEKLPTTIVEYAADGVTPVNTWNLRTVSYLEKAGEKVANGHYVDTEPANIFAVRYSKKANKVAMQLVLDSQAICYAGDNAISAAGLTTDCGDTPICPDLVTIFACGFGTYKMDGDMPIISSLSGNCAGEITADICEDDVCGFVASMCEDFENWCVSGFAQAVVPVSGTWKLTYVKKLSKGFSGAIPSFARAF